jgi:Domain of unknown function (DUF4760)
MRPATLIPWCLVALLVGIGWIGACEQPFCVAVGASVQSLWKNLLAQPAAAVATIALIVTIFLHGRNLKATQLSNSAKMVLDAFARFDSKEMRERRKRFATALKTDQAAVRLADESPVLDFFEDIAHLVHRGVLDEEMVWNSFGHWVTGYYRATTLHTDLIANHRRDSNREDMFREFSWLNRRIDHWRRTKESVPWDAKNDGLFLAEESTLVVADAPTGSSAIKPM